MDLLLTCQRLRFCFRKVALRKAVREKREFGNFYGLVKLVQELFPKEEKQLMSEYASIVDPNKKTARCLLEYCEVNGLKSTKKRAC